jgi:hypothetical protein
MNYTQHKTSNQEMIFTSEKFESYSIITNPDFTVEEVKDVFYDFIAFLTYTNNFVLNPNLDSSVYYKNEYRLYDAVYIRQFAVEDLQEMYSDRDIRTLLYGPEYNSLLYSAKSIFISNLTTYNTFNPVKERYIIKNILEIEDLNVDKFITSYQVYDTCKSNLK